MSFINQFSKKYHRLALTASDRKGARIQNGVSWFCYFLKCDGACSHTSKDWNFPSYFCLETKSWIKPKSWQTNQLASTASTSLFLKKTSWSSMASKWPLPVLFCGMNHQKYKFSLIYGTFSVGGCWGQPMLLFWKLVDETQIFKPPEPTRHHYSRKLPILLPLKDIYFRS